MPTTTSNLGTERTTGYTITIGEIIGEFEKAKTRKDKKEVLEKEITLISEELKGTGKPENIIKKIN